MIEQGLGDLFCPGFKSATMSLSQMHIPRIHVPRIHVARMHVSLPVHRMSFMSPVSPVLVGILYSLCTGRDTSTGRDKCIFYALVGINVNSGKLH